MKATGLPTPAREFTPRTVQITFETKAELDAFTALMNFTPVSDIIQAAGSFDTLVICEACEAVGGEPSGEAHRQLNQSYKARSGVKI